eukprot:COSAG01_NODE_8966_length_2600_cov_4.632947_6_plen_84_part_01
MHPVRVAAVRPLSSALPMARHASLLTTLLRTLPAAIAGKGHLGARTPSNLMINRGFDRHFGFLKGGEDHLTQCLSDRGFPSGRG